MYLLPSITTATSSSSRNITRLVCSMIALKLKENINHLYILDFKLDMKDESVNY